MGKCYFDRTLSRKEASLRHVENSVLLAFSSSLPPCLVLFLFLIFLFWSLQSVVGLECRWAIEAPTSLFSAQLHSFRSLSQDSQALLLSQVTSYLLNLSEVSQYYCTSKVVSGRLENLSAAQCGPCFA